MGEMPESVYAPTLRPVLTIVGGQRTLDTICKLIVTNSFDQKMDYESVEFSHNFETRRDGKMFDKYVSQGILKLSWTTKCKKFVPAAILLVFDWCGASIDNPILESPDWKHKENVILKYLRKFKDQCKGRIVKIGVLGLLGNTNEEVSIEEKVSQLKKSGEVDSKGILLLKTKLEESDQVIKLKKYLWEGCITHYKDEIDRIKKLKSRAQKELSGNFIELHIRYNFKLGYYSELRQDKESALNFYKKSYKELQENSLEATTQIEERRSVADLIVHRMQCLLLSPPHLLGRLKEAISTFKSHVFIYKILQTKSSPQFELWKWLSEHFSRFGTLLEKVPAEIYEKDNFWTHPGFYFTAAGIYYMIRMKTTIEDPEFMQSFQNWQSFVASANLRIKDPVYIGKSKTLASHPLQKDMIEGISTSDQVNIIKILEEFDVKHLQLALEYLFKALKFYRNTILMGKICLYISNMLGDLYKKKGDADQSYQYKCEIVKKMDGWDYVQKGLLDELIQSSEATKKPLDTLQWAIKSLEVAQVSKIPLFEKLNDTLRSNLTQIRHKGLITAKTKFETKSVAAYSSIKLFVTLINVLPCEFTPIKVSLIFSDPSFNVDLPDIVTLRGNKTETISHTLIIKSPHIPQLQLLTVIARYEPVGMSWIDFEIDAKAKLSILSPSPQLSPTFNHLPPALIGENYTLNVKLHPYSEVSEVKLYLYEEVKEINQRRRTASIDRDFDNSYEIFNGNERVLDEGINISNISDSIVIPFRIIFYEEKNYMLKAKFCYLVHKPFDIVYKSEDIYDLDITVQPPFQFKITWPSLIEVGSRTVLNMKIWNICNTPIYLYKIVVVPESQWQCTDCRSYQQLEINEGNVISEDFIANCNTNMPCILNGHLLITWSRQEGIVNDCRIPINSTSLQYFPFDLNVVVASEYYIGQVFEMQVKVKNKNKFELEARIVLDDCNFFLISGIENSKFDLRCEEEKIFNFSVVGVEPGLHPLPVVNIKIAEAQRTWQGKVLILP
jgi:hypothetical protein